MPTPFPLSSIMFLGTLSWYGVILDRITIPTFDGLSSKLYLREKYTSVLFNPLWFRVYVKCSCSLEVQVISRGTIKANGKCFRKVIWWDFPSGMFTLVQYTELMVGNHKIGRKRFRRLFHSLRREVMVKVVHVERSRKTQEIIDL